MKRIAKLRGCIDIRRLIYGVEARRLPAYDRKMARSFDSVLLTSMVDRQFLFDVTKDKHDRVMIVPNGVDPPLAQPLPISKRNPGEIVFVGHMHSLPNFDAAWNFARLVLPLIRSQRPDACLRIIGPIRSFAKYRLSKLPGVRVEGHVASISQALATARVGVCPTRAGAGINNKVLDYMSNGLAVVSSRLGNEGLNAKPDEELLIANSRLEWSAQVLRLLNDDALAQQLADAGRRRVVQHHRWGSCMAPAVERMKALLGEPQRDTSAPKKPRPAARRARTGT
ncbi:MAG TPA: glycosyltransferase family 4 protein, partial [Gammaproteobacteria bacterium]|nr:glycosyltransferase family 4 protein [Gammaproteobacteria bacterium]